MLDFLKSNYTKSMNIAVIGAGFGGLSVAALLAKDGHTVKVFEQLDQPGGKAILYKTKGFTFDMGPSWYLMPEVFERFFGEFGKKSADYYRLEKLDPQYRVYYPDGERADITPRIKETKAYFESVEPGAGAALTEYLKAAKAKYYIALDHFLYRNLDGMGDVLTKELIIAGLKLNVWQSMEAYVSRYFKSEKLKQILMYNLVFLGGSPKITPALYSLMAHVDFGIGVYYPIGGFHAVARAMEEVGRQAGVSYDYNSRVGKILTNGNRVESVVVNDRQFHFDAVVSGADYAHTERLIDDPYKVEYGTKFWQQRTMAPSAFILYLGVKGTLHTLTHHTLIFGQDWKGHFGAIFDRPSWPHEPSLYICNPNNTEPKTAPLGHENLFVLVPIATTLNDNEEKRQAYADYIVGYIEKRMGIEIQSRLVVNKIFSMKEYRDIYHSLIGSAFGLAHTLWQTAFLRPKNYSSKLANLFFSGQMTQPGIGVPISIISGELARQRIREKQG